MLPSTRAQSTVVTGCLSGWPSTSWPTQSSSLEILVDCKIIVTCIRCYMSSHHYCGEWGQIREGHRILRRASIVGLTHIFVKDPCPFGTVAHMNYDQLDLHVRPMLRSLPHLQIRNSEQRRCLRSAQFRKKDLSTEIKWPLFGVVAYEPWTKPLRRRITSGLYGINQSERFLRCLSASLPASRAPSTFHCL